MLYRGMSAVAALAVCAGLAHSQTFTYAGGPVAIPDAGGGPVSIDIPVASAGAATSLIVDFHITHTWQGDLLISITHVETNTTHVLVDRPGVPQSFNGFSADNFGTSAAYFSSSDAGASTYDVPVVAVPGTANVTGAWRADGGTLSSTVAGLPLAGTWRLTVEDFAALDVGTIQSFQVRFNGVAPVLGRCCLPNLSCVTATQTSCANQGGAYGGDNTTCATACPLPPNTWLEQGETGELPGTANVTSGAGALNTIVGAIGAGDADLYRIQVCDSAAFSASLVGGATFDTQLFLFTESGMGVSFNDDNSAAPIIRQSRIDTTGLSANGVYYVAISGYDKDPLDVASQEIWLDTDFFTIRTPDGPGAANPLASWGTGGATGGYTLTLTGACFATGGSGCYANCDNSTTPPTLNVADFTCFLQQFAAGNSTANCDNSTTPPTLNVADFTCFLQRFAAGCS